MTRSMIRGYGRLGTAYADYRRALAAGPRRAKTPKAVEINAGNPAAAVHALRDEWVAEQRKTPQQINSGQCFDFASELESRYPEWFEAEGFGNFCNHNYEAGECSDDATHFKYEEWMEPRGWHPPQGLTWDDMFRLFSFDGTHGWAYCEQTGLCYDIETPDGVKNVFDLPFLQRIIRGHVADEKTGVTEAADDGARYAYHCTPHRTVRCYKERKECRT